MYKKLHVDNYPYIIYMNVPDFSIQRPYQKTMITKKILQKLSDI